MSKNELLVIFNSIKRWHYCYLLFLGLSCNSLTQYPLESGTKEDRQEYKKDSLRIETIRNTEKLVRSADLIVRTGKDFTSEMMRNLSQTDKTYSHCGIASWENDTLFVYHALGGEWNPDQKLRRDPFELFCNPFENREFGVFRYALNDLQTKALIREVHELFRKSIRFDNQFDLNTDDRMYCSEFVFKSLKEAIFDSTSIKKTMLNNIQFIAIDNLYLNPLCKEITRIHFTKN